MMRDNIEIALSELRANKMRSFLTMLGIVIGIASVITIMTVGESMNAAMNESMNEMGANNIDFYVTVRDVGEDEDYVEYRDMKEGDYATEELLADIERKFSDRVRGIALTKDFGTGKIGRSGKDLTIDISGVNPTAERMNKLNFLAGRDLSPREYEEQAKVIVISSKLAEKLFGSEPKKAVGQSLECTVEGKFFGYVVVGVYEHKESAQDFSAGTQATTCYIPIRTAFAQKNEDYSFSGFQVVSKPGVDANVLLEDIKTYVNGTYYKSNDTYWLDGYSMQDWIKESADMVNTIKLAMSAIAAISLLVGGIGVMNIMVVSITERTKEIGIRKALGATNQHIRMQFITESIVMCLVGGAIGVLLGVVLGLAASKMLKFPGTPPLQWILISVLFSIGFGVFFGFYPANKAAKMKPIDALSYE